MRAAFKLGERIFKTNEHIFPSQNLSGKYRHPNRIRRFEQFIIQLGLNVSLNAVLCFAIEHN